MSGFTIGMPFLKLNNVGRRTKKCGSFSNVAKEALEEREGVDPAIDKSKTADNIYIGYRSARELMEYSEKHIEALSEKQKADGGKAVRKDAVVMIAGIIKPPRELMVQLSDEEQEMLLRNALDKISEIVGHDNLKSAVIHTDERVKHLQYFFEPMTADDRLCAKEVVNLKFFNRINREVPEYLRSRGWNMIKDCKACDATEEELLAAEEREKRFLERSEKNGRNTAAFISDKISDSMQVIQELEKKVELLERNNRKLSVDNDLIKAENETLQRDNAALLQQNELLRKELSSVNVEKAFAQKELSDLNIQISEVDSELSEKKDSLDEINITIRQTDEIIAEQSRQLAVIANEVLDRQEYNAKAKSCWDVLEGLRTLLAERYDSLWPFRNRKAEKGILEAVSSARDYIMGAIFAMAAFEKKTNMPEEERVSDQIERGLHKTLELQMSEAQRKAESQEKRESKSSTYNTDDHTL